MTTSVQQFKTDQTIDAGFDRKLHGASGALTANLDEGSSDIILVGRIGDCQADERKSHVNSAHFGTRVMNHAGFRQVAVSIWETFRELGQSAG